MTMHMRRSVYEKCLSGEYHVDRRASTDMLQLKNRLGIRVKSIRPGFLY